MQSHIHIITTPGILIKKIEFFIVSKIVPKKYLTLTFPDPAPDILKACEDNKNSMQRNRDQKNKYNQPLKQKSTTSKTKTQKR